MRKISFRKLVRRTSMRDEGQCQDGQREKDKYDHCVERRINLPLYGDI